MKEKKINNLYLVIIVILAIVVPIVTHLIDKPKKQENDILIVTNYSDFYTVESCLNRMNSYVNANDADSVLLLINNQYKKKNKINKNNLWDFFPNKLDNSNFISSKMYYQTLEKNIKKFYVQGELVVENFDGITDRKTAYYIVFLDLEKKIFSIEPYNGDIFLGGVENE